MHATIVTRLAHDCLAHWLDRLRKDAKTRSGRPGLAAALAGRTPTNEAAWQEARARYWLLSDDPLPLPSTPPPKSVPAQPPCAFPFQALKGKLKMLFPFA
jgi:hypothetical protein